MEGLPKAQRRAREEEKKEGQLRSMNSQKTKACGSPGRLFWVLNLCLTGSFFFWQIKAALKRKKTKDRKVVLTPS